MLSLKEADLYEHANAKGGTPSRSANWSRVRPEQEEDRGKKWKTLWRSLTMPGLEQPPQLPELWKHTELVEDRETGDRCTATLYVRDLELFLSQRGQLQLSRNQAPTVQW